MIFPLFYNIHSCLPLRELTLQEISQTLADEYTREKTEAVRLGLTTKEKALPVTTLGGPMRWCGCGQCASLGYRNTDHVDWQRRTGLVSIDIDDMDDAPATRETFRYLPEVALCWVSARGRGLKLGVAVNPVPMDARHHHDAWAAVIEYLDGFLYGNYRFDGTKAAVHPSFLAYDPYAVVRIPTRGVPWTPGQSGLTEPVAAPRPVATAGSPAALIQTYPWHEGTRNLSVFKYGGECARRGYNRDESYAVAIAMAYFTDMIPKYSEASVARQFNKGYESAAATLLDWPPSKP